MQATQTSILCTITAHRGIAIATPPSQEAYEDNFAPQQFRPTTMSGIPRMAKLSHNWLHLRFNLWNSQDVGKPLAAMLRAGHVGRQGRYHLFECCQLFIENFFRRLEWMFASPDLVTWCGIQDDGEVGVGYMQILMYFFSFRLCGSRSDTEHLASDSLHSPPPPWLTSIASDGWSSSLSEMSSTTGRRDAKE